MNLKIRQANLKDAESFSRNRLGSRLTKPLPTIRKIILTICGFIMNRAFSPETLEKDLQDEKTIYLIAESGDEAIGYAKIQFDAREDCISDKKVVELCRLYALDKFIGKGVGKSLMLEIFQNCRRKKLRLHLARRLGI